MATESGRSRRQFLVIGAAAGTELFAAGFTGSIQAGKAPAAAENQPQPAIDVTPPEDLMREHGILNRALLIYEECLRRLREREKVELTVLVDAAKIIRTFIEDYHEKQEEDFLFPRFERAGKLVDLVKVLREQHQAGRRLTDQITKLATPATIREAEGSKELSATIEKFVRMYRPHEAREDTVLFPELRSVVTAKEFDELGDRFEENEHKLFGEHGFEDFVAKVAECEKKLGIYDLSQFTPKFEGTRG